MEILCLNGCMRTDLPPRSNSAFELLSLKPQRGFFRNYSIFNIPYSIVSYLFRPFMRLACRACLLVLTERKCRQQLIFKMPGKTQQNVQAVLDRLERQHRSKFKEVFKSITMDNGSEFLDMEGLERSVLHKGKKRTICYYAHPYSAWERGSNENANRLIRRFIPKGADIGKYTSAEIQRIEHWMNNYPRRMFGYKTANDMAG